MLLTENQMMDDFSSLGTGKSVLLIEPPHNRKYLPLGLAKISTLLRAQGADIRFSRYYDGERADYICVSSLFTYDMSHLTSVVKHIRKYEKNVPVLLGGVCATLNTAFLENRLSAGAGVRIFEGYSCTLDRQVPDYSLNWDMKDGWDNFSFVFTSRGCPNNCGYCVVPKIEPRRWENELWYDHIQPEKPFVMISDNNLSACSAEHFNGVCDRLSFKKSGKYVVFDNGFDPKHIDKDVAVMLSRIKYMGNGLRTAFDRISECDAFQYAMLMLTEAGICCKGTVMAYVLFNFNDTPKGAEYRAERCIAFGVKPYPQRYVPLHWMSRTKRHVGRHWTDKLAKAFSYYYNTGRRWGGSFDLYMRGDGTKQWGLTEEDYVKYEEGGIS